MNTNQKFFFVLLSAAAAIGLNQFAYSYFSFRLTGLFFIQYLIALLVLGIPLLMLEFSVGQYFSRNVVDSFASVKGWLGGIGWLMIFNAFIVMGFYAVVLSWHIIYVFASFGLQWKDGADAYFLNNVLQASEGFKNFAQFSLPVFIALIIAWALIFFCIRKGSESIKKCFFIAFPIFVLLMLLFFAYSLNLENALAGVYSFLNPNFDGMFKLESWVASFGLAVSSLGLSFGVMTAFSRKSDGFIVGNSFVVAGIKILVSIASGFIFFGILGFLSIKQGSAIDALVSLNFSYPFRVLAQALPFFGNPVLISILFFAFLSIFFIFITASLAYSVTNVLVHKLNTKHVNVAIITAGFGFLFGLLFVLRPGFYIMDIVSHFIYYNILIAILLEVLAVGWFLDSEKISDFINQKSVLKIGGVWRFIIRYLAPLILLLLLFFQIKSDYMLDYGNYPLWALVVFGIGTIAVPLFAAFLMPQKLLDRR